MTDKLRELITADFFLQHETKYTQRWDHVEDHDDCYTWECSCGAIEESKFHSWEECHFQTRRHWAEKLIALLAEQAPAGESARKGLLELREPDEMIAWLNDLNSNWAVCRNTRSFKEGQPSEYWKKFDKAMGAAFELQIALMKLAAGRLSQPVETRDPAAK